MNIFGQMAILIKETSAKIWDKEKEIWRGMMEVYIQENGKGGYHMAKVLLYLKKPGIFKVKGYKPRVGYFEDNVLISESREK